MERGVWLRSFGSIQPRRSKSCQADKPPSAGHRADLAAHLTLGRLEGTIGSTSRPWRPTAYEARGGILAVGLTLVERVTAELREAILEGRLEPGKRIGQVELAQKFGTSRLPVREALSKLEHEGLVSVKPNAGATVARLTMTELTEIYLMRERLEPLALAASIPNLSDEEIVRLRSCVDEMEETARETADRWAWLEIDRRFHLGGLAAAPMPQLLRVIESLWNNATRYRRAYTALWFPSHLEIQHAEHRLLINAIEERSLPDAEVLLEMHIRRTRLGLFERRDLFADGALDSSPARPSPEASAPA